MSPSIPMSLVIGTEPSVLEAGGNPLALNGVLLTTDPSIPIGVAQPFLVGGASDWFGANSPEATLANRYFSGFNGADSLPETLYFYQYNEAAVAAYLRSGSLAALTLTQLQAFSGTLIVTVDGEVVTSANIDLSTATSFTNAATLIQAGLRTVGGVFTGTGTVTNASATLTINTTTTGRLHIGDVVVGTNIPAATTITAFGTYTPGSGVGTVTMSTPATGAAGPEAITVTSAVAVSYDALRHAFVVASPTTGVNSSVGYASGTLAANIELTQVTGAIQSIGAAAATPASAMNGVVRSTQNWASFSTVFAATTAEALGFANWVSTASPAGQERFIYVEWDADTANDTTNPSNGLSFGAQVTALAYNGVIPVYDLEAGQHAAFVMGFIASLDFDEAQGTATLAFKGQASLPLDVTDAATAIALGGPLDGSGGVGNGYNYYGAFATSNQGFNWMQRGTMPGPWRWVQPYVNQIAMNADFQLALAELASNVKSIPYNTAGYNLVRSALSDTIAKYVNFGAIQPGVPLSAAQAQAVNLAAGAKISGVLSSVGYYLQILPASPTVRGLRGSPPMKFWYTDGGSIQSLFLATIDVQ
jgi:hypothetical protein